MMTISIEHYIIFGEGKLPISDYFYPQIPNGIRYILIFPSPKAPDFKNFLDEARQRAGESEGLERVKLLTKFVYEAVKYDKNFAEGMNVIMLYQVLKNRKGVCLEKAALLYMILTEEDFDASFAVGNITDENGINGHAWVEVLIDGKLYVADPTHDITMVAVEFYRKLNVDPIAIRVDLLKLVRS